MTTLPPLQASIIIATYNRASYLALCLDGLAALNADKSGIEVIIIDNNSTDNTAEVIQEFIASHDEMRVRHILETQQGASRARNRGIREAQGEILCFLDDDTIATPTWFQNLVGGFVDPSVGCVGGPAILNFLGREVPPWLRGDLQWLLSGYQLRYNEPTEITKIAEYPYLCNMAIRREVLERVGLFQVDLGPNGNNLVVGEETELMGRIAKAGWKIVYLPDAQVAHLVSPERAEKRYIYRACMRLAVTHIYLTWDSSIPRVIGRFLSDLWYTTRMLWGLLVALLRRDPLWFDKYIYFWMIAIRIPLRIEALIKGKSSISTPKPRPLLALWHS